MAITEDSITSHRTSPLEERRRCEINDFAPKETLLNPPPPVFVNNGSIKEVTIVNQLVHEYLKLRGYVTAEIFRKEVGLPEGCDLNLEHRVYELMKTLSPYAAEMFGLEMGLEPELLNSTVDEILTQEFDNHLKGGGVLKNDSKNETNLPAADKENSLELIFEKSLKKKCDVGEGHHGLLFVPKKAVAKLPSIPDCGFINLNMKDEGGVIREFRYGIKGECKAFSKGWKTYLQENGVAKGWTVKIMKDSKGQFFVHSNPPKA